MNALSLVQIEKEALLYRSFFKAISNPVRLKVIKLLKIKPQSVKEIVEKLNLEQSHVSHNLKCLLNCGFVKVEQKAKQRIYSLDEETIRPFVEIVEKHIKKYEGHLETCEVVT